MFTFLIFAVIAWLVFIPPEGLRGIARKRLYKSGTGWCAWRWTDVDSEYITRLHVIKTPWCALCLHWINSPDVEPWLHDHPVSFLSVVLRGGYAELRAWNGDVGHRVHKWFNFIRASKFDRHRIIFVRKGTVTLCFMGPKTREWGFHMPEGWVHWKDYYARLRGGEDVRRCPELSPERFEVSRLRAAIADKVEGTYRDPNGWNDEKLVEFSDEEPTEPRRG